MTVATTLFRFEAEMIPMELGGSRQRLRALGPEELARVTKSTSRRWVCGGRAIFGSSIAKITESGPRRSAM
jgi:hypothetical protein